MKYRQTKDEQETFFSTTEADKTWNVFTQNKGLMRRMREYSEKYPEYCRLVRKDEDFGSETYEIDKSRVTLRLNPPASEERKKAARERLQENMKRAEKVNQTQDPSLKTAV